MSDKNRFDFGKNWMKFIRYIDEKKIEEAVKSLQSNLKAENLKGKTFIDVGCGSGLFSLAAMRLKADRVISFDFSEGSVNATRCLKANYHKDNDKWIIMQGSVLNKELVLSLGKFDIVYSWGVLHHTGDMYQALENVIPLVKSDGQLFIAIYNNQGIVSSIWKKVKLVHNKLPDIFKLPYVFLIAFAFEFKCALVSMVRGKSPFHRLSDSKRGMSIFIDWVDWIGGYPFEVACPEKIFNFYREKGFSLEVLKTCGGGYGNNEFVFRKK
ncbi:MAG: class I SAM-dependent methyltransferase [Elusimicrobia bacterium]|nr:class I SAM-dependent methyltransferase [Elusimicrobiota bacterium]